MSLPVTGCPPTRLSLSLGLFPAPPTRLFESSTLALLTRYWALATAVKPSAAATAADRSIDRMLRLVMANPQGVSVGFRAVKAIWPLVIVSLDARPDHEFR